MPRPLHVLLGLMTLLALAMKAPRFVASRLPDGWWPGSWVYDAWIASVAVGVVLLTVRVARGWTSD